MKENKRKEAMTRNRNPERNTKHKNRKWMGFSFKYLEYTNLVLSRLNCSLTKSPLPLLLRILKQNRRPSIEKAKDYPT